MDFNVPIKNGVVKDPLRIVEALPSIQYVLQRGARSVVLMSHLGRPDGARNEKYSLAPLVPVLESKLGGSHRVTFLPDCVGAEVEAACANPRQGQIFLLENLRFHIEEEGSGKRDGKKVKADKEKVKEFRSATHCRRTGALGCERCVEICQRGFCLLISLFHFCHLRVRLPGLRDIAAQV